MSEDTKPIHPGVILYEEFVLPSNITKYRLAKDISVPPIRISEIINGKRSITADTAIRLGRYFSVSPQFWLNLQTHYNLEKETLILGREIEQEVCVFSKIK